MFAGEQFCVSILCSLEELYKMYEETKKKCTLSLEIWWVRDLSTSLFTHPVPPTLVSYTVHVSYNSIKTRGLF